MDDLREQINSLGNTGTLENMLIAIAYWLFVIVVILFIFWIVVKINNYRLYRRRSKPKDKDDFFL